MMQNDMGSMMKMHTSNLKIYDLLKADGHSAHHGSSEENNKSSLSNNQQNQAPTIYQLSYLSTALIFLLLPLIIAGVIILAIVWIS